MISKTSEKCVLALADPSLLREECLIGGRWSGAEDAATIQVKNPATGELVALVPSVGKRQVVEAIEAARSSQASWQKLAAKERSGVLERWFDLIVSNGEDLAKILTAEQGKPISEARAEIAYAASFVQWFAEEAKRVYGDVIQATHAERRILVIKQPVGVVAAITPWNFPAAMITRKVGPCHLMPATNRST